MNSAKTIGLVVMLALGASSAAADSRIKSQEVSNFRSTLTRAEVQAQAVDAYRNGRFVRGEFVPNEIVRVQSTLTRAQVLAEAAEARRLGLVPRGNYLPQATAEQAEMIRLAGLRAVQNANVSGSARAQVTTN